METELLSLLLLFMVIVTEILIRLANSAEKHIENILLLLKNWFRGLKQADMKTPDILNSKIKRLQIELPHYSFSHSSAGDSSQTFIGRKRD